MTCSACSAGIEKAVGRLDGVNSVSVSLMGKCMDVSFDETRVAEAAILSAVEKLGYTAGEYGETKDDDGAKKLKKRFFICCPVPYINPVLLYRYTARNTVP